jgi:hypothetical protein
MALSGLYFEGTAESYLRVSYEEGVNGLELGTSDFTIEWYQYQTDNNPFPRIFQIGYFNDGSNGGNIVIGVSIETYNGGRSFLYWTNSSYIEAFELEETEYKNKYVHFAICRSGTTTKIFMNGMLKYTHTVGTVTDFVNGTFDLVISNEYIPTNDAAFGGYIKYFAWDKGTAHYSEDFTVSSSPPTYTITDGLLLTESGASGSLSTNIDTTSSSFSFVEDTTTTTTTTSTTTDYSRMRRPLYTNNALVFYKANSLASGGVGGVSNSRIKSRRT